jgi:hypothetical protein
MRHGHKSVSKGFQGSKASVVVDTTDGVVLATGVIAANQHDQSCAKQLVAAAAKTSEQKVERLIGDTAYGSMQLRREMADAGVKVVAKMQPISNPKQRFTVEDFDIDTKRGVATCPNDKQSLRRVRRPDGVQYVFSKRDCTVCPMRDRCTAAKRSRVVTVADDFRERQRLRAFQRTDRFRRTYRRRIVVEHRLGRLVQLGIRKARYFGKVKTAFQIAIAAAMANLTLANAKKALLSLLLVRLDRIQLDPHAYAPVGLRFCGSAPRRASRRAA